MRIKKDVIIVGQGISGTVLSAVMMRAGKTCLVIDCNEKHTASKVSAGLYNPIVFKRVVKSWKVDVLIPALDDLYSYMEQCCNNKFHVKREILKVFVNKEELDQWMKRASDAAYQNYLDTTLVNDNLVNGLMPNNGLARVRQAGNVDVPIMLQGWKDYLIMRESYTEAKLNYSDIDLNEQGKVIWKNIEADYLIFCEGYAGRNNPYFPQLPFVPAKGELLQLNIPALNLPNQVLNKGVFVFQRSNKDYTVGATYAWHELDHVPTEKGSAELLQKFESLIQSSYQVKEHVAGIRPSTRDRRPWIGKHPEHQQLSIFNGMGTKAVMLAPYFANQLFEHLYHGAEIETEASIKRVFVSAETKM